VFDPQQGQEIFLYSIVFIPVLIQWVPGDFSREGLKRPGLEADHFLPSDAEVKNMSLK
jgi:hypothetical protein